jgi:hypothetical protein
MYKKRRKSKKPARRRGVILLVVLSLLTLFAVVGISFVLYADAEAESSRIFREAAANPVVPDMDPEQAFAFIMSRLVYDVNDDASGAASSLRGLSLARSIYGAANPTVDSAINDKPFNGVGRLHIPSVYSTSVGALPFAKDDFYLINYIYSQADGFVRDPERTGTPRANPSIPLNQTTNPFTGGFNAPYTYPDLNNMFLAAMRADGTILSPSFFRYTDYTKGFGSLDPKNSNWTTPAQPWFRYMTLRPRPVDHATDASGKFLFPLPEDAGGDVKNLTGFPSGVAYDATGKLVQVNNDSIWIDIGAPVMTTADGRKFKMLVAPLILDLDGRINLNVHGNVRGAGTTSASNLGIGRTEVNISKVMTANATEWTQLFLGNATNKVPGRYGPNQHPDPTYALNPQTVPFCSPLDMDGCNETAGFVATTRPVYATYPPAAGLNSFYNFPYFAPMSGFGNGSNPGEWTNSPLFFNPFKPRFGTAPDDLTFAWSEMEAILRHSGTNSPALTSNLQRLCPTNFGAGALAAKIRNMVTTHSFHLDRPAVMPWVWNPNDTANPTNIYQLVAPNVYPTDQTGAGIAYPPPSSRLPINPGTNPPGGSNFDPNTWRSAKVDFPTTRVLSAALNKVDLNRKLTDYPHWLPTQAIGGWPNPTPIDPVADQAQLAQAQNDRQQFANDIFAALLAATGSGDPTVVFATAPNETGAATTQTQQFQAMRWLAQLSANIVDYIDDDDFNTVFLWYTDPTTKTPFYVVGTEQPRLVINEAYAEIAPDTVNAGKFSVNFWAELLNPLNTDAANLSQNGDALLQMPDKAGSPGTTYPVYNLVIATSPSANTRKPFNILGDPDATQVVSTVNSFVKAPAPAPQPTVADYQLVHPINGAFGDPTNNNGKNLGFYALGPTVPFPGAVDTVPLPLATLALPTMSVNNLAAIPAVSKYDLFLRRLACPYLPPQINPALPNYNPYITVDYITGLQANDAVPTDAGFQQIASRLAFGRKQPFAADIQVAQAPSPILTKQPQHTFFRHNSTVMASAGPPVQPTNTDPTLKVPFDWLVHLDRFLISPMELLHVSGFKPHELTQQFMQGGTVSFGHRAPWYDQNARIYRAFEFLETHDPLNGTTIGGRLPGLININTIFPAQAGTAWDASIFQALCDATASNYFTDNAATPTQDDVNRILQNLIAMRTPTNGVPTAGADFPLLPLSSGNYPGTDTQIMPTSNSLPLLGTGINRTFLQMGPAAPGQTNIQPLFDPIPVPPPSAQPPGPLPTYTTAPPFGANPANNHPYIQKALLTKIFNNLTTRSNVFGVWMTVGFFEVKDDTTRPVLLGAEIGKSEGRNIRHRMFALVDRTSLSLFSTQLQAAITANTPVQVSTVLPANVPDSRTGNNWPIQVGMTLTLDQGTYTNDLAGNMVNLEESVIVMPPTSSIPQPYIIPKLSHSNNAPVTCYGNPGPWTKYDPRQDNLVVPYFSIID